MPQQRHLALEGIATLISLKDYVGAHQALCALSPELAALGRMRFLAAQVYLALGDASTALTIMADPHLTIADYREGENTLTELWQSIACSLTGLPAKEALEKYPLPQHLDYRMR